MGEGGQTLEYVCEVDRISSTFFLRHHRAESTIRLAQTAPVAFFYAAGSPFFGLEAAPTDNSSRAVHDYPHIFENDKLANINKCENILHECHRRQIVGCFTRFAPCFSRSQKRLMGDLRRDQGGTNQIQSTGKAKNHSRFVNFRNLSRAEQPTLEPKPQRPAGLKAGCLNCSPGVLPEVLLAGDLVQLMAIGATSATFFLIVRLAESRVQVLA